MTAADVEARLAALQRRHPWLFTEDGLRLDIAAGWLTVFEGLCDDLAAAVPIESRGAMRLHQVKEKFAHLRVVLAAPAYWRDTLRPLLDAASERSVQTCRVCGAATGRPVGHDGVVVTLCPAHDTLPLLTEQTMTIDFEPAFRRVAQAGRHDDAFACIATLTGHTLAEVFTAAEDLGLPRIGPYCYWIDGLLLGRILARFGWEAAPYQPCQGFDDLPGLALAMVDCHHDYDLGRNVVFHRPAGTGHQRTTPYIIDPWPHADQALHIRSDLSGLTPCWFMAVSPPGEPPAAYQQK